LVLLFGPDQSRNPGAKIVNDAIEAYANFDVGLPEGPPKYLYGEREECRQVLERVGFEGTSMSYDTRALNGGFRTRVIISKRNATQAFVPRAFCCGNRRKRWRRFASQLKTESNNNARGNEFVLTMAANVIVVSKN